MEHTVAVVNKEIRQQWNEACKYEERYIALLDIMGFSNLVNDENNNCVFVGLLHSAENLPHQPNAEGTSFSRVQTAIISDTLVVSASKTSPTALEDIIYVVRSIFLAFLDEGIVIRGGICCGKLFHQNNIVFGPAMVEAHQLEQNIAIYPRIVLSPNTQPNFFDTAPSVIDAFVQDFDGVPYLDLYRELIVHAFKRAEGYNPNNIRYIVNKSLNDSRISARVKQKYLWMKEHFNSSLKEQLDNHLISVEAYESWLISE